MRDLLTLANEFDKLCQAGDTIASRHLAEVERKINDLIAMRGELQPVVGSFRNGTVGKIIEMLRPRTGL